jgi:hypothetical protein
MVSQIETFDGSSSNSNNASVAAAAARANADLWVKEQMFEEDVRAVLMMMRPHGRERLMGWNEYRTGGAHFRVTVSWDGDFERTARPQRDALAVPNLADVIEALLVGSSKGAGELPPHEEFGQYRAVVRELGKRIDELEACYT